MTTTPSRSLSRERTTANATAVDSLVLAFVGSGGDGVALLGDLVLQMAAEQGLYGVMVQSYGPQIRGGESAAVLRIATAEVQYEGDAADLLLCFHLRDLERFRGAVGLKETSLVVLEASEDGPVPEWLGPVKRAPFTYPFARIEQGMEVEGDPKNMLALALVCRMLGWPDDLAREVLRRRFEMRPRALAKNLETFDRAWNGDAPPRLPHLAGTGRDLVIETGNEAAARGAMEAGLRFFAGYPITPSSEIMQTLIDELPEAGGRIVQAEDEIAALGMVLGASFGGVPSMTATSGPGLSLMTEMLGLSSMAELPAIVVDCQRAGPATGMPSRTEQSDLYHAVYGGHGDFPRVVLGVFDVVHGREVMHRAMHIAEAYQLPVLVLSDAYIAQRRQIRTRPPAIDASSIPRRTAWKAGDGPARFDLSGRSGVNPFRVPGTPGATYHAAGIEHTEAGDPTSDTRMHQRMNAKRFSKLASIASETADWARTLGKDDAPRGIVAWGSQYGILREYVERRPEFRVFLPEILHPFPLAAFERWRQGLERCDVLELSFQAQFFSMLASLTDTRSMRSIARSGGAPITQSELDELLGEVTR